jgi:DNA-binding PadR family transcriptional regulator
MAKSRRSNPLALAVLVLLFERPMHPYEMAATLEQRRKEDSIKIRYGSLYTVIELLQKEGDDLGGLLGLGLGGSRVH